jgi:hypothetical protein
MVKLTGALLHLLLLKCVSVYFSRELYSSLSRSGRPTFRGLAEDTPIHDASEHGGASRPAFRGEWLPRLGWEDHCHLISSY